MIFKPEEVQERVELNKLLNFINPYSDFLINKESEIVHILNQLQSRSFLSLDIGGTEPLLGKFDLLLGLTLIFEL